MEFLFSNIPPLRTEFSAFYEKFYSLIPKSSRIDIAVGYVSAESLIELKRIIELNENIQQLNLVVGMHYYEHFTKIQYNAAMLLNEYLRDANKGEVKLVNAFKYHGKLYSYSTPEGPFAGIIGSNNLGCIVGTGSRPYESALLIREHSQVLQMRQFIEQLSMRASRNIAELEISDFNKVNPVLQGHESVRMISNADLHRIQSSLSGIVYEIPVKTEAKSNLNCYFGKGRENTSTHVILPRHWYEAEIIVPTSIRKLPDYPRGSAKGQPDPEFRVYTDDGYSFMCQVNGGSEPGYWNKNLRSSGDLTILGKWIKGRLENEGVLRVGEILTDDTLQQYGRTSITMTRIQDTDDWYFDFGVRE